MMSQTLIASNNNGLEALVSTVSNGGLYALGASWQSWFEAAALQLENDDSIDSRLTDEMADALGEAEEAINEGRNATPALNQLVSLYHRSQASLSLEAKWTKKAQNLGLAQLETATWNDLHLALDAAEAGHSAPVAQWLEAVEETFIASWESYEQGDVLEEEITTESVLCHRFLMEGAELWLGAINEFKQGLSGGLDRSAVLAQAEAGQRLLILVQLIEQEANDAASRFFAAWAVN